MANLYWVGNSGNWNDASKWSLSSGGAGGAGIPGLTNDVVFDANSFSTSGLTVTIPAGQGCQGLDMSAVTNTPTFSFSSPAFSGDLAVAGDINIPSGTIFINSTGAINNTRGLLLKSLGVDRNVNIQSAAYGVDIIFSNQFTTGHHLNYNITNNISVRRFVTSTSIHGAITIITNNHAIQTSEINISFSSNSGLDRLDMGSSIITLVRGNTSVGADYIYVIVNGLLTNDTSTIHIQGNATISTDNYYNVVVDDTIGSSTGICNLGHGTFHDLTIEPDSVIAFTSFNTTSVSNAFSAIGTVGHTIGLSATTSGQRAEIDAATASVAYCLIKDLKAGGAGSPFDATNNCTDLGNNLNWIFAPPFPLPNINSVGDLTYDSGILQGDIFDFSSLNFDELGLVFSDINTLPTIFDFSLLINPPDPVVIRFGIIGPYYVNLTGLIDGQTYYVRTFGQIGGVYYYGPVISFVTPARAAITLPGANSPLSNYQFLLYDPAGNLVADLSGYIDAREFTLTRNRPEEITFTINFYTLNKLASDLHLNASDMLKPGIQEIRVVRKGTVICAGQIVYWDASLGGEQQITVKALGWMNLFSYRVFSGEYDGDDANFIIRDIITQTQALTNGNFGVTLGASATGTNVYTQKIFENKVISDILIEMSEEENGFDFQFSWDKIFTVYHPSQGSDRPEILFTSPGNMKEVTISNDATQIVNSLLARGKGNADANINTIITDSPSQVTYKLRTAVKDYPDMDADQLIQEASAEVAYYRNPVVLHTITYDAGNKACPEIGNYNVGDRVRIFVTGLPILQDFNQYFKIDKIHVTLGKDGSETVELSVNNIITL